MMRYDVVYDVSIPGREFSFKQTSTSMGAEDSFPAPSSKIVCPCREYMCEKVFSSTYSYACH